QKPKILVPGSSGPPSSPSHPWSTNIARMKRVYFLLAILLSGGASFAPASAQVPQPDTAWNGERALELIGRAQDRRSAANADSGLSSYRADARIHVYFYLDRPDTRERNLVKTDQL